MFPCTLLKNGVFGQFEFHLFLTRSCRVVDLNSRVLTFSETRHNSVGHDWHTIDVMRNGIGELSNLYKLVIRPILNQRVYDKHQMGLR